MKKIIALILLSFSLQSQTLIKLKQIENATAGSVITTTGTGVPTWTNSLPVGVIPSLPAYQQTITGGYLTPTSTSSLSNKSGNISQWTNDAAYTTTSAISNSFVPNTRSLNINGTAYDLSADRTWSILTGSTTILTPSTNITIIGSAPNYTISTPTQTTGLLSTSDASTLYLPIANPAYTGSLNTGTLSFTDTGILAAFQSSTNGYNQLIIQNTSTNNQASSSLVVGNNSMTAGSHYVEIGKNSSTFTGTSVFSQPNYGYVTSTSADLSIGTTSANAIHIAANSASIDAITINTTNVVNVPSKAVIGSTAQLTPTFCVIGTASISAGSTLTGIQNNGNYNSTGTGSIGTTFTVGGAMKASSTLSVQSTLNSNGITNVGGITASTTGSFGTTLFSGGTASLNNITTTLIIPTSTLMQIGNATSSINIGASNGVTLFVSGGMITNSSHTVSQSLYAGASGSTQHSITGTSNFIGSGGSLNFYPTTTEGINVKRRASATTCLNIGSDASSNASLTVTNADMYVNALAFRTNKIYGNSAAPTVTAGSGLGTGAGTVISVTGNDISGIIGVTTGTTGLTASAVLTYITFNVAYVTNPPVMVIQPYNAAAANLIDGTKVFPSASTATAALNTNTIALPANTTFSWSYHALGR